MNKMNLIYIAMIMIVWITPIGEFLEKEQFDPKLNTCLENKVEWYANLTYADPSGIVGIKEQEIRMENDPIRLNMPQFYTNARVAHLNSVVVKVDIFNRTGECIDWRYNCETKPSQEICICDEERDFDIINVTFNENGSTSHAEVIETRTICQKAHEPEVKKEKDLEEFCKKSIYSIDDDDFINFSLVCNPNNITEDGWYKCKILVPECFLLKNGKTLEELDWYPYPEAFQRDEPIIIEYDFPATPYAGDYECWQNETNGEECGYKGSYSIINNSEKSE